MGTRGRTGLAVALAVAVLALTSCVGIGAITEGDVRRRAQERGGGVTTDLVDDAIAAVSEATGEQPLVVHSITATLAEVAIVVPTPDGSGGRDVWSYGTSGLLGHKGLEGPTPSPEPALPSFPIAVGQIDVDRLADQAREAAGPGHWVDSVTIARPAGGAEQVTTVVVTAGSLPSSYVFDAVGALVQEGEG